MPTSYETFNGDGSTKDFTFTFDYIAQDHVTVEIDGVATTAFSFIASKQVRMDSAPASGTDNVLIRRTTPNAPLTDFVSGSTLSEEDLDRALLQSLYVAEEARDALEGTIGLLGANFNAQDKRIINLGAPSEDDDASTKIYVDDTVSAAALGGLSIPLTVANGGTGESSLEDLGVELGIVKNNTSATTAPGVDNDTTEDYVVGSLWLDTTADVAYVALDVSGGAALWVELADAADAYSFSTENVYTAQQRMTLQTVTSTAGAVTFDFAGGDCFIDLAESLTSITLDNLPENAWVSLFIQQGTGAFTVTGWPAAVKWRAATAPTISTTDNAYDVISLYKKGGDIVAAITQDHR